MTVGGIYSGNLFAMTRRVKSALLAVVCAALVCFVACRPKTPKTTRPAVATPSPTEQKRIAGLLDAVEAADGIVFLRNEKEYPSWAARQWIERKYNKYGAGVLTAEDFISSIASRSETTKKPYSIRLADGRTTGSAYWLRDLLAEVDAPSSTSP